MTPAFEFGTSNKKAGNTCQRAPLTAVTRAERWRPDLISMCCVVRFCTLWLYLLLERIVDTYTFWLNMLSLPFRQRYLLLQNQNTKIGADFVFPHFFSDERVLILNDLIFWPLSSVLKNCTSFFKWEMVLDLDMT